MEVRGGAGTVTIARQRSGKSQKRVRNQKSKIKIKCC